MIRTVLDNLPCEVKGFTIEDENGDYTVILNARCSWEMNFETYRHEIEHIGNGDLDSFDDADDIEYARHRL